MVISVGYRVSSSQATLFRRWATAVLVRFATKGFVVDADRLKNPDEYDRVRELREIVRDIRASEANLYAELRRICAFCQDYDPKSKVAQIFYREMQAKLFYAVTSRRPPSFFRHARTLLRTIWAFGLGPTRMSERLMRLSRRTIWPSEKSPS